MNFTRSKRSNIQLPRDFNEGYATLTHIAGILLLSKLQQQASRSSDMIMRPSIESLRFLRLTLIVWRRILNLAISCKSTVVREGRNPSSLVSNKALHPSSLLRSSGIYIIIDSIKFSTSESLDQPPFEATVLGYIQRIVLTIEFDAYDQYVMSAFSLSPNTRGSS